MKPLTPAEQANLERYWVGDPPVIKELKRSDRRTWQCARGHLWETPIHRILSGRKCHYCTNRKVLAGFNDLATTHPDVVALWDFERNTKNPTEVLAGTRELIAWKCQEGHQWEAIVYSRTQGLGCPICSGKQVLAGYNDLATLHPHIAAEWSNQNTLKPNEVTAYSSRKVFWECENQHTWKTTVKHRSLGTKCPQCVRGSKISALENEVLEALSERLSHYTIESNTRKILSGKELDIYIPALRLGIEVNGTYWHSDLHLLEKIGKTSFQHHYEKALLAQEAGVLLLYVWERDWKANAPHIMSSVYHVIEQLELGISPHELVIADELLKLTEDV